METVKSTVNLLSKDCFMASIDLKDAYLHVPIHSQFQKYLRIAICINGSLFHLQFQALPFGIAIAPRVFTKIVAEMAAHVREGPAQRKKFLGIVLDSSVQRSFLPEEKIQKIQSTVSLAVRNPRLTIRRGMSLLGLFTAAIPAVPWAQTHSRPLQTYLLDLWDGSPGGLDRSIVLTKEVVKSLSWWLKTEHLSVGLSWVRKCPLVITTDASPSGWGAHLGSLDFQGSWDSSFEERSSNFRELAAISEALKRSEEYIKNSNINVLTDNSTAVAIINRQGTTRSKSLLNLSYKIFAFAEINLLSLSAVHLKGSQNIRADYLSRNRLKQGEWKLSRQIFQKIVRLWGSPEVDLFATRENRQIDRFYSLSPMDKPMAVDALSQTWGWDLAYAFPPIAILPRVLRKIRQDQARVILIAPFWPRRAWFSALRDLSIADPWVLPELPDLLSQGPILHPQAQHLHLTAWLLRG
ncbi:uncharacterized protein [Dendropsophus ebraccatus]|uniref:uncharacterized protein n=1 Tax=Dendropsophus ebraccatus TaxID=150705 RepID=UPI0038317254